MRTSSRKNGAADFGCCGWPRSTIGVCFAVDGRTGKLLWPTDKFSDLTGKVREIIQGSGVALVRPTDFAPAGAGEDSDVIFGVEEAGFADGRWRARGMLDTFKHDTAMPDSECTIEYVLGHLPIYGTPDEVAEKIVALRRQIGPFGTLLYVGHDWADAALARRSMELMATRVMPAVNRALGE